MKVLVSPFKNPYINLALEDFFLRNNEALSILLFYINRPSVVFGRFQNPWIECQLPYLSHHDIWPVRRQSGGGCVYHDEGNLNYSFIYPTGKLNRLLGCELIQKAFRRIDIELFISERHDLWLDGKKISGSAFKQTKDSSFHHGTFLLSADLDKLHECLKSTSEVIDSKSIASVRSKVTRLCDYYPDFSADDFIELIAHELKARVEVVEQTLLSHPMVQESFVRFIGWEWLWGETPYFKLAKGLEVRKGEILEPLSGRFERSTLAQIFNSQELDQFFPDFPGFNENSRVIF